MQRANVVGRSYLTVMGINVDTLYRDRFRYTSHDHTSKSSARLARIGHTT